MSERIRCRRMPWQIVPDGHVFETGQFVIDEPNERGVRAMYIRLPNSTASGFDALHIIAGPAPVQKPGDSPIWGWDGDEENPTLEPSIQDRTPGGWHGYLRKGWLETC